MVSWWRSVDARNRPRRRPGATERREQTAGHGEAMATTCEAQGDAYPVQAGEGSGSAGGAVPSTRAHGARKWRADSADEASIAEVVALVRRAGAALGLPGDVEPFGSHVNGFSTSGSDWDLTYVPPQQGDCVEERRRVLQMFAHELPNHGFDHIVTVFQATVPLLKAVAPCGTEVDLCVANRLGLQNSRLMNAYCRLDPRVGKVARLVKHWAKAMEIVGSSDGHLNSYAYTLLVIHYLMHANPPVVPNLQAAALGCEQVLVRDRRWGQEQECNCTFFGEVHLLPRSLNREAADTLLLGFFRFYTDPTCFNWEEHAVSIRLALTQSMQEPMMVPKCLSVARETWCVEDPFDVRHNLAAQCTQDGRRRILDCMRATLAVLQEAPPCDVRSIFDSHCDRSPRTLLKCRVCPEKAMRVELERVLSEVREVGTFRVYFPLAADPRVREVLDAFLEFEHVADRRRVHRLNESFVGDWQLRLLPCSQWALQDALSVAMYEEFEVPSRFIPEQMLWALHAPRGDLAEEAVQSLCSSPVYPTPEAAVDQETRHYLQREEELRRAHMLQKLYEPERSPEASERYQ